MSFFLFYWPCDVPAMPLNCFIEKGGAQVISWIHRNMRFFTAKLASVICDQPGLSKLVIYSFP